MPNSHRPITRNQTVASGGANWGRITDMPMNALVSNTLTETRKDVVMKSSNTFDKLHATYLQTNEMD